jgi:cell division protein FtsW|tara:strand:- start:1709 stop:2845 length:1137 start_codon:yes stop_codon:yes gene_type:complete
MFNINRENQSNLANWFRNIDKTLLIIILILFFFGLFFSFSSTSLIIADKLNIQSYHFFLKHLAFVLLALGLVFFISIINKDFIKKFFPYIFFLTIILLLLVPFFGLELRGSKRWIEFLFFPRFQPIEIVKPFFILIIAKILASNSKRSIYNKSLFSLLLLSFVIFLLAMQPDLGQSILLFSTWLIMIFASGVNLILLILFFTIFLVIGFLLLFMMPDKFGYILVRLQSFIDPTQGNNYQSDKALEAIINGGFFGQGIGEGILKDRVPEAHTDYIIAVIAEEFGTIFLLILMLIFLLFGLNVLKKIINENDNFIKISLLGLISIILIQAFIHIGVNIRLFPTTGITLPFVSYGGSSIIGTSIIVGLIVNLTKRNNKLEN